MASGYKIDEERQADCDFNKKACIIIEWVELNHLDNKIDEIDAINSAAKECVNIKFVIFESYCSI